MYFMNYSSLFRFSLFYIGTIQAQGMVRSNDSRRWKLVDSTQQSLVLAVGLAASLLLLAKDNIVLHLFNLFIYFLESYSDGWGGGGGK